MSEKTDSITLNIQGPDGKNERHELSGNRVSLGRSRDNDICYPDDASLSRVHLVLERDGENWYIQDQRSKNGTKVNSDVIRGRHLLRNGDRIYAGRLAAVYEGGGDEEPVEFLPEAGPGPAPEATVMTSLDGLLSGERTSPDVVKPDEQPFRPAAIQALIRAGRELSGHRPLKELFELILDLSLQAVGAERGLILTLEGEKLVVRATRGEGFQISAAVRDRVVNEKTSLLVQDVLKDEHFQHAHSLLEQNVRTIMAVPLQTDRDVIGLVYVDSQSFVKTFHAEDLNLLTVLANVAAIRVEQQRLVEVEQKERIMARDLEQAEAIQRQLLPAGPPQVAGVALAGSMAASRTVGGDYFDYFDYGDRVGFVIADVSGKGMPAALVMTNLQARVRLLAEERCELTTLMSRLDHSVAASVPDNRFISLFFGVLNPSDGELSYCNAGHNPPILIRGDGTPELLSAGGGTVLGMMPDLTYTLGSTHMEPGDVVTLFSDGVTEAADPSDEEFGQDRLIALLRDHRDEDAEDLIQIVLRAITEWTEDAPPADDITVVVARRT